jgi:hypothetical protein
MDAFEIDLDSECVWLDDAWLNRDDLVRKIRGMIDAGDYQLARPSQALEALTKALAQARLLALRITPEMSDALNQAAQMSGRPLGAIAREAIATWLTAAAQQQPQGQLAPAAQPVAEESIPAAEPAAAVASAAELAPAVSTEPVSAEEAANAVDLTPKHAGQGGPDEIEKRWYDK